MSDPSHSGQADDQTPLFQNQDEQERVYAPQQVPGAVRPAADDNPGGDEPLVAGAEGNPDTTPMVVARPEPSLNQPLIVPVTPGDERAQDDEQTRSRAG